LKNIIVFVGAVTFFIKFKMHILEEQISEKKLLPKNKIQNGHQIQEGAKTKLAGKYYQSSFSKLFFRLYKLSQ
jgi:hypothetical protein